MKHILSVDQFNKKFMAEIFEATDKFKKSDKNTYKKMDNSSLHLNKIMINMFYEPSTRTRFSFEIAAKKLGIEVIGTENAGEFSSAAKGETIEDTVKVFNEYGVDVIILRTQEEGITQRAAKVSKAAILNGGDGKGEHPTQALLDMYTIKSEMGRLENLKIAIGGDLMRGRTARSLAKLISKYPNNEIVFVSSDNLRIGEDIKSKLNETDTKYSETTNLKEALVKADVVYWTRMQLERSNASDKHLNQSQFKIDENALNVIPDHSIILHPLPRQGEIPESTDSDPRAKYFQQSGNGLYVRMALLNYLLL
jgi:aspartate carbamoyltransferase catalytic subunit